LKSDIKPVTDGGGGKTDVRSVVDELPAIPPPDTVAMFVTIEGELQLTLNSAVIGG
jgi:hypothetical protein